MSPRCFPTFSVQVCKPSFPSFLACSLTMFSRAASSYWRLLPLFAPARDREHALTIRSECIDWLPRPRSPGPFGPLPPGQSQENIRTREICEVLSTNDLYHILGVARSPAIDRLTLRRAYLSRSKACHPESVSFLPLSSSFFVSFSTCAQQVSRKPRCNACVPKSVHSIRRPLATLSQTQVRRSPRRRRPVRCPAFTPLRVCRRNPQRRPSQHHQRLPGRQPRNDTHAPS